MISEGWTVQRELVGRSGAGVAEVLREDATALHDASTDTRSNRTVVVDMTKERTTSYSGAPSTSRSEGTFCRVEWVRWLLQTVLVLYLRIGTGNFREP